MIDIQPTPGNWSSDLTDELAESGGETFYPMLHEPIPSRASQVLGPDGEPVQISVPRNRIGFDLRPKQVPAA